MPRGWTKEQMADEIIAMIEEGACVNLGIGMPTLIAERMPADRGVIFHSENGVLGVSGRPTRATVSPTLINAGKETISVGLGASYFDSALSFGMIRGGHIDVCVLGGMEVDAQGSLANWMVPGKKITGMGGAMDLVNGAKRIIVMLTHASKTGECKLMRECRLPLTGVAVVDTVVTELGVFSPQKGRFHIEKLAAGVTVADLGMPQEMLNQ